MIKKGIVLILTITILIMPMQVQAKTIYRYTTPAKVSLKTNTRSTGKTAYKVKTNTKLAVTKQYKVWAQVKYNGKTLYIKKKWLCAKRSPRKYTAAQMKRSGVIRWGGCKWTYYTQRILPGRGLNIPGRHLDKEGFVCDRDGYIVVAMTRQDRINHTVVPTPFGKFGKCYDCGGGGYAWRDLYTNW